MGVGVAVLGGRTRAGEPMRIHVVGNGERRSSTDMIRLSRGADAQDDDDDGSDTNLCDTAEEQADRRSRAAVRLEGGC